MPSFLSKVFVRRKEEKDTHRPQKRSSVASLLEGKFEAVSPSISPSASNFAEPASQSRGREKERDAGFSLFRTRSRPLSPAAVPKPPPSDAPHLTLNLPVPKEEKSRALGVVFEADPDDRNGVVSDSVIGQKRLNPHETLLLVKACSAAIVDRGGLETLGVMHPHWYSASPDIQRKLISLFILSLAPKNTITTLSPNPNSPLTIFNTELEYTRSPHDIAAVLRWALRHLRLGSDSFGVGSDPWQWYANFADAERAASYPPNAFSQCLAPQLPPAHMQLLVATLEILSSLAAHSERNGTSGSKLSKFLGLWLLTARRSEDDDEWSSFYARWERAGRILEHLFLAQIRDDMVHKKMPLRLAELVASYPFHSDGSAEEGLLPRPRLSTRRHDALYVRVEVQLPDNKSNLPKQHPFRVITDATKAESRPDHGEYDSIWDAIKQAIATPAPSVSTVEVDSAWSRVFTDETIRLLSLVPGKDANDASPATNHPDSRSKRSLSPGSLRHGKDTTNGTIATVSSDNLETPKDWSDFSTSGFGESALGKDFAATLLDSDIEVTKPPLDPRKSNKRKASSTSRSGVSSSNDTAVNRTAAESTANLKQKCTLVSLIQLDEAFVDFWSDALLDPIASDWPTFVVCQLKPLKDVEARGRPISWLVLEQVFTRPASSPKLPSPVPAASNRTSSPKPSERSIISSSKKSSTFSPGKKRFTFFSNQTIGEGNNASRKKAARVPTIGEMGEVLTEVPESKSPEVPAKVSGANSVNGLGLPDAETSPRPAPAARIPSSDAARTKTTELPPVPITNTQQEPMAVEPVSTATIKIDEEPGDTKPTMAVPHDIVPPSKNTASSTASGPLPSTSKSVALTGDTPGPDVAVSTSEPVSVAEAIAERANVTGAPVLSISMENRIPETSESMQTTGVEPQPMETSASQLGDKDKPLPDSPSSGTTVSAVRSDGRTEAPVTTESAGDGGLIALADDPSGAGTGSSETADLNDVSEGGRGSMSASSTYSSSASELPSSATQQGPSAAGDAVSSALGAQGSAPQQDAEHPNENDFGVDA